MKIQLKKLIAILFVFSLLFSFTMSACATGEAGTTTSSVQGSVTAKGTPDSTTSGVMAGNTADEKDGNYQENTSNHERSTGKATDNSSGDQAGSKKTVPTVNQKVTESGKNGSVLLTVLIIVLIALVLGLYFMVVLFLKKQNLLINIQSETLMSVSCINEINERAKNIQFTTKSINEKLDRLSEETLLKEFVIKTANTHGDDYKSTDNYPKTGRLLENSISNSIKTAEKPLSKYDAFLNMYNKLLADEISKQEFDKEFIADDYIRVSFNINREGSFYPSPQGHITVYSQTYSDDQYQIAVLNKEERSSFNNKQIRDSLEKAFDFNSIQDLSGEKLICIRPAKIVKKENMYKIVSKGSYSD